MDVEKTIEFLLQSQADLTEKQQQTEINISRLIEAQYNTEQNVAALSQALAETDRRLDSVAARLDQLAERQSVTEASLQTQTENLNALIKVVDDFVRGRQ
jgi:chromosome segregation ATPase